MSQLPPEIWIHIAHHLPSKDLCQVYAVNRTLLHVSMDHRWADITVENKDLLKVAHVLKRLLDPFIAARVRRLVLRLFNVEPRPRALPGLLLRPIHTLSSLVSARGQQCIWKPNDPLSSFSDFCSALMQCIPHMINLTALSMDSWNSPPSADVTSLYRSLWTYVGANLETLVLIGCLDSHKDVILSQPILSTKLKVLQIGFAEDNISANSAEQDIIMSEFVVRFVNSFSSQLQNLGIWYWSSSLDLSQFFAALDPFPRLNSLSIRMSSRRVALIDPSGLQRLISSTSDTVKHLELRLNMSDLFTNNETDLQLGEWLLRCLDHERWFANVETLDLYPSGANTGVQVINTSVRRASRFLRRLHIRDIYWTHSEAMMIVGGMAQCSRLRDLRIDMHQLDVELWDQMAECLPNLTKLEISLLGLARSTPSSAALSDEEFSDKLRTRRYDHWKLKDLSIRRGGYELSICFMLRFCLCMPSIETFFGRPPGTPGQFAIEGQVASERDTTTGL